MSNSKPHTTHFACQEIMDRDGNKAVGCCCTGHKCKQTTPKPNGWENLQIDDSDGDNKFDVETRNRRSGLEKVLFENNDGVGYPPNLVYFIDRYYGRIIHQAILSAEEREVVICAAIRTADGVIARGHRHNHCFQVLRDMGFDFAKSDGEQGFITSKNRFVSREEGRILQDKAGIKSVGPDSYQGKTLFSEDLY